MLIISAEGGASNQFLTLGECPAIYLSRLGAIPQRRSKKKMLMMLIDEGIKMVLNNISKSYFVTGIL